jgi:hypothetical protein
MYAPTRIRADVLCAVWPALGFEGILLGGCGLDTVAQQRVAARAGPDLQREDARADPSCEAADRDDEPACAN